MLVIGALLRAFIDVLPDPVSPAVRFSIKSVDSIVGYYALMFSLPFFAHRVFAVEDRRPFAIRPGEIPAEWGLSDRETEVARLAQQGLSNKDIAEQLHISPNTVKTHLRLIFDKSGVRSRFELIAAVHRDPFPEPGHEATKRG